MSRVVGQNTHELGMYVGAVPLVLCAWLASRKTRYLSAKRVFMGLALVSLVYAFGEFGPIYRVQSWLPMVSAFRFPCRAIVVFQLAVAGLSAIALVELLREHPREAQSWHAGMGLVSIAVTVAALLLWPEQSASWPLIAAGPLLIVFAVLLVRACERGCPLAPTALVLFTAADLAAYGLSYAVLRGTSDLNQFASSGSLPPHPTVGRVVADDRSHFTPLRTGNRMLLAGFSRADGYAGLEPAAQIDPNAAGVEWIRQQNSWRKQTHPLAKVRLTSSNATPNVVRDDPGNIVVDLDLDWPNTLIVAERFHAGWKATLDGAVIPIVRRDHVLACNVPAGCHRLELRFAPTSLYCGRLLSLCGLGFTVLILVSPAFKRPRCANASSDG
jgi:hypothetical protein